MRGTSTKSSIMKILHSAKKGKNIFTEETVDWQLNETKNIAVK